MKSTYLIPEDPAHLRILLDGYMLEKAIYEIGYELNNRPDWINVPLQAIMELIETEE
jgi:maltose alpha-D-glucosyltransferase/alpha-amylase